jgi:uncharacterized protein YifE (UPF0438 family)
MDLQQPFVFGCSTAGFMAEEIAVLNQFGTVLESLASGFIPSRTAEDEHFLKVDRDEADPLTVAERAGVRLKGRREFELGDLLAE